MILFPEKFNLRDMAQGVFPAPLSAYLRGDTATHPSTLPRVVSKDSSREVGVEGMRSDLERYLFMSIDGRDGKAVSAVGGGGKGTKRASKSVEGGKVEERSGRKRESIVLPTVGKVKKSIQAKLASISQNEFLELYFSPLILNASDTDIEKAAGSKNYEVVKELLGSIARRKAEVETCTQMYSKGGGGTTTNNQSALARQVKINLKVLDHLKVISTYSNKGKDRGFHGQSWYTPGRLEGVFGETRIEKF
jgi:hypothetical protein